MKLIDRIFGKSYEQVADPANNKFLRSLFEFVTFKGVPAVIQDNPTAYLTNGYAGNPDVYALINRIVRMSAQARLCLYRKDEKGKWVEETGHELTKFLKEVNPTMKTSDFVQGHLIYKLTTGNSYWYKPALTTGANKGKSKELWLLPANDMEVLRGSSWMNPIGGYRFRSNTTVTFDIPEVLHSKFFNPLFGYNSDVYGQSPLKAAAKIISKQNEAVLTELKQFENQSPPYALVRDSGDSIIGWTEQQAGQLESKLKKHAQGSKRGSGILLTEKVAKIDLGSNPVDLNILQSTEDGRRILCNILGFPAVLMNDMSASTFNNQGEARKAAWSDCIKPNLTDIAADLTSFLIDPVPEYKGLFFEYDYSQVMELQADIQKQVTWMRSAFWTPNQILDATGQQPYNNPAMDEPWMPMSDIPLSQAVADIKNQPLLKNFDYK